MKNSFTPSSDIFVIRGYTKSELAHIYLPHYPIRSALRIWNEWVHIHPTLLRELEKTGYKKTSKMLSPAQVRLIVQALGEP